MKDLFLILSARFLESRCRWTWWRFSVLDLALRWVCVPSLGSHVRVTEFLVEGMLDQDPFGWHNSKKKVQSHYLCPQRCCEKKDSWEWKEKWWAKKGISSNLPCFIQKSLSLKLENQILIREKEFTAANISQTKWYHDLNKNVGVFFLRLPKSLSWIGCRVT